MPDRGPDSTGETARLPRTVVRLVLGLAVCASVAACSTVPVPPTYTDAELQAMCERRGGWWRGNVIAGYCEFQAAALTESP